MKQKNGIAYIGQLVIIIKPGNMRKQVASNQDILTGRNNDIIHTAEL